MITHAKDLGADKSRPFWRAPGLQILRSQTWAPLTLQETFRERGEGVWRHRQHRLALVTECPPHDVQIENGPTIKVAGSGPRLFFYPADTTVRIRIGAVRSTQLFHDPESWRSLMQELPLHQVELAPLLDFEDPLVVQMMTVIAGDAAGVADRLLVDALNTAIAVRVLRRFAKSPTMAWNPLPGLSRARLRRVLDYVEAHLDSPLSLGDLAAVACLSPYHFSRSFKQSVGVAPHRYVMERRMERARHLILRSDMPLSDIAAAVGFDSQASFTYRFGREAGVSPGRLRRERA